ncbi:MAG: TlyA family RNA methyltransferase [Thermodesulfovibrionales bacterium]|nr:TlyA family RNA methyltransferase [Thermodesulfovibrionales bacterium]
MPKKRLDRLLVEKNLVSSREKAKALIMGGKVLVNGVVVIKAGTFIPEDAEIEVKTTDSPYVSRGGLKLEAAIKQFNIDVNGKIAMDVGSSTGGFTDCLLQFGAARVYCIDVGYGQLAWKLRIDDRVRLLERTNIRYIQRDKIPDPIDLVTIDVSFISLTKVIPKILDFLKDGGELVALIKPQFEVGKGEVDKGGIVKKEEKRLEAVQKIKTFLESSGLKVKGVIQSPILGGRGNVEYLIYCKK